MDFWMDFFLDLFILRLTRDLQIIALYLHFTPRPTLFGEFGLLSNLKKLLNWHDTQIQTDWT